MEYSNSVDKLRLKQIQSKLDDLEANHFEERKILEKEYQEKFQPLYTLRYEIVNANSKVIKSSNETVDQEGDEPAEESGVPNFWLNAMKSNEVVAEMIQKHDEDALRYLIDIKWRRVELSKDEYPHAKATGFMLEFFFDPNPYFENPVLSKTYCMLDEDIDILLKAIGTEIEWFPRKCLTNIVLGKWSKPSGGMIRTVLDSFFNFFNRLEMPDADVDIDETVESMISLMKQDYNVGVTLREDIIPHAVLWFTGEIFDNESGDIVDITNSHKTAKVKNLLHTVQQNVKLLKDIQSVHDGLEDMFFRARRDRDDKYLQLCQPLFRERYEIVNGIKPADHGEIKSGKGVPNFWLNALKANEVVAKLIQKQDEEVLKCVKDIRWQKLRDPDDEPICCFELEFCFGLNPYFNNSSLTKSFFVNEDYPFLSTLENVFGTEIEWLDGQQLTGSFFDFFTPSPDYNCNLEVEEWRSLMKADYNVGLMIRNHVIPHAVELFTEDHIEDDG